MICELVACLRISSSFISIQLSSIYCYNNMNPQSKLNFQFGCWISFFSLSLIGCHFSFFFHWLDSVSVLARETEFHSIPRKKSWNWAANSNGNKKARLIQSIPEFQTLNSENDWSIEAEQEKPVPEAFQEKRAKLRSLLLVPVSAICINSI